MAESNPAQRKTRVIFITVALLLPTLSLVPLGGLYLYQQGWLLYWAVAALAVAVLAVIMQRRWLTSGERRLVSLKADDARRRREGHLTLSERAWRDVKAIAAKVDVETLTSTEAVLELGQRTIDAVARRMHPESRDAMWQFTLPEALVIAERVSSRLGQFVETQIPLGDRLTVAQLLAVYRWRGMVGVAERAYDIWRVIRLANPTTAVTHEAREQLSRAVLNWSKERVGRRIAEAYVEEVGRAAIDLYGGRLRPHAETQAADAARDAQAVRRTRALRALVTGSAPARIDALPAIAAVADKQTEEASMPRILFKLNDAIEADHVGRRQFLRAAGDSDVVIWCIDGRRGVPDGDLAALEALKRAIIAGKIEEAPAIVIVSLKDQAQASEAAAAKAEPLEAALERFSRVPFTTLLLAEQSPERELDAAAIVDAIREQATRAVEFRTGKASDRGGIASAARQAVSAAGALAGQLFGRRS